MGNTEKNPRVTFNEVTSKWLEETYPAAMTDPEKVRMAVNDAMRLDQLHQHLMEETARLYAEGGADDLPMEDESDEE